MKTYLKVLLALLFLLFVSGSSFAQIEKESNAPSLQAEVSTDRQENVANGMQKGEDVTPCASGGREQDVTEQPPPASPNVASDSDTGRKVEAGDSKIDNDTAVKASEKSNTRQTEGADDSTGTSSTMADVDGKAETKAPLDRPWIIKQKNKGKKQTIVEKPSAMKWINEEQKTKCENYLAEIKEKFLRTRYYSIQGDPCNTANHAEDFLSLIDQCKQDCPQGFLEESGYTDGIIRNLKLLRKSGIDRCLSPGEQLRQ